MGVCRRTLPGLLEDLARPHDFAFERVGFLSCRPARTSSGLLLLAESFHSLADEDYLPDETVGSGKVPVDNDELGFQLVPVEAVP